jgi:hypothetical protein
MPKCCEVWTTSNTTTLRASIRVFVGTLSHAIDSVTFPPLPWDPRTPFSIRGG